MMVVITITERTPTREEHRDTNTYHVICEELKAPDVIQDFFLNFGCLVSITIAPWKE